MLLPAAPHEGRAIGAGLSHPASFCFFPSCFVICSTPVTYSRQLHTYATTQPRHSCSLDCSKHQHTWKRTQQTLSALACMYLFPKLLSSAHCFVHAILPMCLFHSQTHTVSRPQPCGTGGMHTVRPPLLAPAAQVSKQTNAGLQACEWESLHFELQAVFASSRFGSGHRQEPRAWRAGNVGIAAAAVKQRYSAGGAAAAGWAPSCGPTPIPLIDTRAHTLDQRSQSAWASFHALPFSLLARFYGRAQHGNRWRGFLLAANSARAASIRVLILRAALMRPHVHWALGTEEVAHGA